MKSIFDKELFIKRLNELIDANGDNNYTLAHHLHLSAPTILRYRSGEISPKITTIQAMASKYNVNPSWLMGNDVEKYLENSDSKFKKIPVLGTIAAGQPILAEENIEAYEFVNSDSKIDFALKVKGDSMINARINDGDIVFIRQQSDVENGEIAAVIIDGREVTLKRVYKYPGTVILRPENPRYQELIYNKKDLRDVKILGKCIFAKFYLT